MRSASIEIDDDNSDAHHLAALIFLDLCLKSAQDCRLAEAEAHVRRALQLRPDFREARNTLGVVLIHEKKLNEAISVLEPLTRGHPLRDARKVPGATWVGHI